MVVTNGGARRAIGRVGVLVFVLVALSGAWEMPFIPWARSLGLWPTLTGRWVGKATRPDGRTSFVYLDLTGKMPGRSRLSIGGQAQWCEHGSAIQEYTVYGRPDNYRGTRFALETSSRTEQTRVLSTLHGQWHDNEMQAMGRIVTYARSVGISEGTPNPPEQVFAYTFHRGTLAEFQQACTARGR